VALKIIPSKRSSVFISVTLLDQADPCLRKHRTRTPQTQKRSSQRWRLVYAPRDGTFAPAW